MHDAMSQAQHLRLAMLTSRSLTTGMVNTVLKTDLEDRVAVAKTLREAPAHLCVSAAFEPSFERELARLAVAARRPPRAGGRTA
jgi:hypothetical protein